ncbi:hypothetical protein NONI108955_33815 [Nocardia ninae]|uniref:Uncharacterized protein n=1 Tax=Nocardia ninae NBRC 108245 TaxID=1210091 RepID=A0A511M5K1_9NOCA|nr:hypothetical protein [Nocardia ninae]GEM35934.1 hypothetical protein NN4_04530 [Nocardia ninae NBRC 108245]
MDWGGFIGVVSATFGNKVEVAARTGACGVDRNGGRRSDSRRARRRSGSTEPGAVPFRNDVDRSTNTRTIPASGIEHSSTSAARYLQQTTLVNKPADVLSNYDFVRAGHEVEA